MYFEDGFTYSQQVANDQILWAFISCIHKYVELGQNIVSSNKLIECGLKKLNISTFDFLNDDSIKIVENALSSSLKTLCENQFVSSLIDEQDKFYKYFAKKELFRSREFSNEFEEDMVLKLIYKLNFSFHYVIADTFNDFYKRYLTNQVILSATKKVTINLLKNQEINILVMPEHVAKKYLKDAISSYDYTGIAMYIGMYNKTTKTVELFTTLPIENDENRLSKLTLAVNMQSGIKKEFMVY